LLLTTEQKLLFTGEKLEEEKNRIASGESQRQVALSVGTNGCTQRR
jgi:hypothetical protein